MHKILDEIFLLKLHRSIEIQHIVRVDEEEQKELDLKKEYDLLAREA